MVAQVYGANLAATSESTGAVPLTTKFKGTQVLVGPYEAPLYYVSPGQLVVQLPNELVPNRQYPLIVVHEDALTLPDTIAIVAVQPGVASFGDGRLIAQHADFTLVDEQRPARRGEVLTMYLVGMGATNPAVPSGAPSPADPLARPVEPVTVTVDGQTANIVFAGLTPFGVGLYQINFRVPPDARLNQPLEVMVTQGGVRANVTRLTVVP